MNFRYKGILPSQAKKLIVYIFLIFAFFSVFFISANLYFFNISLDLHIERVASIQSQLDISSIMQTKFQSTLNIFYELKDSKNIDEANLNKGRLNKFINDFNKVASVLENGGVFDYLVPLSFNNKIEFRDRIRYKKRFSKEFDIQLKGIKPLISRIELLIEQFYQLKIESLESSEKLPFDSFFKNLNNTFIELEESINHLYFEAKGNLDSENKDFYDSENFIKNFNIVSFFIILFLTALFIFISFRKVLHIIYEKESVKRLNDKLLKAVNWASCSIIITDQSGNIEYVNHAFEKNSGYLAENVLGKRPSILKSGHHKSSFYEDLWDTISKGKIWNSVICNKRADSTLFREKVSIIPIIKEDNSIDGYIGIKDDITDVLDLISKFEDSKAMEMIFDKAPIGIMLISMDKKIIKMNNEAALILKYDSLEEAERSMYGKLCFENFCSATKDSCPIINLKKKSVILEEKLMWTKDRSLTPVLKSVIPIKYNSKNILLEMFVDIKSIKTVEMKERKLSKAKTNLLNNIIYEVEIFMDEVIEKVAALENKKENTHKNNLLTSIENSKSNLLNFINTTVGFLDFEIEKTKVKEHSIELDSLIFSIVKQFKVPAMKKSLELLVDISYNIFNCYICDSIIIANILMNLIDNAIKFTKSGQVVTKVSLIDSKDDSEVLKFSIEDSGIGITSENRDKVFEEFIQLDENNKENSKGSGLGTTIAKNLTELIGGSIELLSPNPNLYISKDPGSVFSFKLKLKKDKVNKEITKNPIHLENLSVLIIDANQFSIEILYNLLSNHYTVSAEINPKNIDNYFHKIKDLIIVDVNSLEKSFSKLQEFKKIVPTIKIVLIGLDLTNITSSMEAIIDLKLKKPIMKNYLIDGISNLFPDKVFFE
ncbi:MAG: hypothetical protein CR982_04125 [Candidatus Cloacimonadota bacterium]|nr:MAG: hypothetical protein CR982_04125 [Candidatus Cloacimonadota bacterium]PIE78160.1 MAG: hypothetical protein CSA15_09225 [Candidatus Delongbacteria bacterium]